MTVHNINDARVEKLSKAGCGVISQANDQIIQYSPEISKLLSTVGLSSIVEMDDLEDWKLVIKSKATKGVRNYLNSVQGGALLNSMWVCWRQIIKDCNLNIVAGNPNYDTKIDTVIGQISEHGKLNNDVAMMMVIGPTALDISTVRLGLIISEPNTTYDVDYDSLVLSDARPMGVVLSPDMKQGIAYKIPHPVLVSNIMDSFLLRACTMTDGFTLHEGEMDKWFTFICKFILDGGIIYSVLEINKVIYDLKF